MTTNQEGRQAAIRDSTSTAYGVAADWHALFDDAGIGAGTFNERLLAWINAELSASHSNLVSAMQAYAEDAGYDGWEDMATLVLAMNGAETLLDGETQGLAFDFTDQSALIIDTGTPANNYDSTGIVSSGSLVGPSGKLTYTNPSNKLTLQSDGVMRYQAHNLCLQSEDLTAATGSWTETNVSTVANSGGATPPANYAEITSIANNATAGAHSVFKAVTAVAGAPYALEVVAKYNDNQYLGLSINNLSNANEWAAARFDLINGTVAATNNNGSSAVVVSTSIEDIGGGWYKCRLVGSQTSTTIWALVSVENDSTTFTTSLRGRGSYSGSGELIYISGAHVYRYPANTDYIRTTTAAKYALPIEYDTSGNCLGLLVEEHRTNVIPYSTTTAQWAALNLTASANSTDVVDIFGLNGATKLTGSGGSAAHLYYPTALTSLSAATNYVASIYVKAGTLQYIQLLLDGTPFGTEYANFDIQNGTATGSDSGTLVDYGIENVGNGWYRLWAVDTSGSTTASPIMYVAPLLVGNETYNPTLDVDGLTFYVMQADCQAGSFPTSPIITYGAAATRNADNISIATSAFPHSNSTQSVFVQVITQNATTQTSGVPFFEFHDGTTSDLYCLDRYTAGAACRVTTGGSNETNAVINGFGTNALIQAGGNPFKGAMSIATNDVSYVGNGGTVTTDATASLPTVTSLKLGAGVSRPPFCGTIQRISVVPRTKSDAELQTETT